MYKSEDLSIRGIEGIHWQPIPPYLSDWLQRPFEEVEVKKALFACDGNKAPGPDGFTLELLQTQWETVKDDIMKVFSEFWKDGIIHGITNATFICLIPKKSSSSRVRDFRPISLVTSLYKLVSKVLSMRLKEVLADTIAETQGSFVAGRQILDVVLVANEIVEEYRNKGKPGVVFKIDFEKAYDYVEWGFLDFVLQKKGFGELWRKWIRGCLSTVSFSVFINGRPRGKFPGSRGLRQGDPLSPFLFTLIVDVLGRMIDKAKVCNELHGFTVWRDKVDITHLQFADDTLFFMEPTLNSFLNFLKILEAFRSMSGLKVNLTKSTLLGINTDEALIQDWALRSGCAVGTWPIKYLGLPLGGNPRKKVFWEPVLTKVAKRLDGWKKAYLSRGGRLTLIQSVLSSLPIYYLSIFKAPKTVIFSMEKMIRDFFWEGGDLGGGEHLVSWKTVCLDKSRGGLGIGNLEQRNKALLMKWLWRFPKEGQSLWFKVIKSIYGLHPNQWDSNVGALGTFRSPWKGISCLYGEFHQMVSFKVGNGNRVRFWEDIWLGENSFQSLYPSLFRISTLKSCPISHFMDHSSPRSIAAINWNFHFSRNLLDREIIQVQDLLHNLEMHRWNTGVEDTRYWLSDPSGIFSCKSAFDWLSRDPSLTECYSAKCIWKLSIPTKVKVFTWMLVLGKLTVHTNLQKRRPYHYLSPG